MLKKLNKKSVSVSIFFKGKSYNNNNMIKIFF